MKTLDINHRSEIAIKRIFNAPQIVIWNLWTTPEYLVKWWGPKFYTSPVCKIDLNIGGKYLFCLRSPKGQDFWSTGTYKQIEPFHQLIFTDSFADENGNIIHASKLGFQGDWPLELVVSVTFEEFEGKTKVKLNHTGFPTNISAKLAEIGWMESFEKIDILLRHKGESIMKDIKTKKVTHDLLAKAEKNIKASDTEVWNALVNPDLIKQYMFDTNVISQWSIGSPIVWEGEWQGKHYADKGTILDIKEKKMIKYNHFSPLTGLPDIPENYHTVTVKLSTNGKQTKVKLTQNNNTTKEARVHSEKQWNLMLDNLKKLLEHKNYK